MTEIDREFARARAGDRAAFARWMELVHHPVRASLRRFARVVDSEVVMQETFLRMWLVAGDRERELAGQNASLRFALRVARNVALEEVRRLRLDRLISLDSPEGLEEPGVDPAPLADPGLSRAIRECVARLPVKPGQALRVRLQSGHGAPDRELAARLGMKVNTFLQNIVRARRFLRKCLEDRGVRLAEILS